ncbi:NAD(P)-dependent dehydrogenase (short-subunit alcohol dehydrogenase family) [Algoriphagus ratkowskyi]|uniref:NAD(P)-dependent dehydrogenase (Short-subunit alcohol dehydrogenase family) n=1 Tax=Algoriphagus ratkowskyi TaxID=57028 RepID=A0A2W7S9Y6_9BACT|nr:SDR family oxidoreductase [Algoriphagus ratkowskyi]PZX59675.1 NAD(P)-dependent dehydrogenase (short-subunit alcohol dehydrogenase family) [Algoriphagus ratkowskyi]TXD78607.1 SDR family oxidoreductase [Algoriphagus ratkowskyi]
MKKPTEFEDQSQSLPGSESKMKPEPEVIRSDYKGSEKLKGKVALITGGDSGIGRSVAVHFAREGADVAIVYLSEDKDAKDTKKMIEKEGQRCLLIKGNLQKKEFCESIVSKTVSEFGQLNILVNNAAEQHSKDSIEEITAEQLEKTFQTNIFSFFYTSQAALPHLSEGDSIINTSSVTSYRGSEHLIDYASTKGAIVAFTRSLAKNLAPKKIRVNGVAPGPIWTPLIPATFDDVTDFGQDTALGRAGQPSEVAPAYVYLASKDASYIVGQFIHVNGGEIIGS